MKSGRDQMVIDPDWTKFTPHKEKRIMNIMNCTPSSSPSVKCPSHGSIHSHLLTGFPVEGENNSGNSSGDCFASLVTFYTAFPNLKTMKALYEFLWPGDSGENIQYLSSTRDDIQAGDSEHSVKQSLKTTDEFFSYIASPQTRLRRNTLGSVIKSKCTEILRIVWPRSKYNFPFFRVHREVFITFQRFWGLFFQIRPTFRNI